MAKYTESEAREALSSLSDSVAGVNLSAEGVHKRLALDLKMGAHRALGMTDREYVAAAGQPRLIDPTDAILELHDDGVSIARIAAVLRISDVRVSMVLAKAGKIEPTERVAKAIETGTVPGGEKTAVAHGDSSKKTSVAHGDSADKAELDRLKAELDRLKAELEEARQAADASDEIARLKRELEAARRETGNSDASDEIARLKRELEVQKDEADTLRQSIERVLEKAKAEEDAHLSDDERKARERDRKAFHASLDSLDYALVKLLSTQTTEGFVMSFEELADDMTEFVEKYGGFTKEQLDRIQAGHVKLVEAIAVAMEHEKLI